MDPLIPDRQTFLGKPRRVSRLYPIFTILLMIASSLLTYRWQYTRITADTMVQERDRTITQLSSQIETLTAQQRSDQATLKEQQTKIEQTTAELNDVGKQLSDRLAELKAKEVELSTAQTKLKQQENQLSANASELQSLRNRPPLFSFQNESTTLKDVAAKQEEIKKFVTSAYDYIQNLYGKPYLLNQITITFVDSFNISGSAGEILIENGPKGISIDIRMKDFDSSDFQNTNTLIHEIIHGFHGISVFESSALEEGMTVAAADAVMERMADAGVLKRFSPLYLNTSDATYSEWNRTLTVPQNNDAFYKSSDVAKLYQLIGTAWMRFYRADPQFFHTFNEAFYARVQNGEVASDSLVRSIISQAISSVSGVPISKYLSENRAFNPS